MMNVKLLMQWDIKPGQDQEYFEFVVREWLPGVNRLGIKPTWAWYTVYSREPSRQILAEAIGDDLPTVREVLRSDDWKSLHERLLAYVENYTHKVVYITGGFQI